MVFYLCTLIYHETIAAMLKLPLNGIPNNFTKVSGDLTLHNCKFLCINTEKIHVPGNNNLYVNNITNEISN